MTNRAPEPDPPGLPDWAVILTSFAIPPAFLLALAYAPWILVGLVGLLLWFGLSAVIINVWFKARDAGKR